MLLASQYYRAPFPRREHWRADLADIKAAGLDAIYLWAQWAWVEPEPGRYVYDDYDEIVDAAAEQELQVIITTVAELQPYWIHRVVPDAWHVDHLGRNATSSTLSYSHVGLAPGGCWDHPEVSRRIAGFQQDIGRHFAGATNLHAWDCWNEFRGPMQADGFLCHCEHTQSAFRSWLLTRYADLDGLNAAWNRRYTDWQDVQVPKLPQHSWTEMMEYQRFLAWRSAEHASFRAAGIRSGDPHHPVLGHSVILSPIMVGGESPYEHAMTRGNDWEMAERLDGFGISNFPKWFASEPPEYGVRVECGRSAAGDRPFWICELQGGSSRSGLGVMNTVPAELQESWIWAAYGRGATAVSFWCWRDEVFGRESSGFGVVGSDGFAADRLTRIRRTTTVLREHATLLDGYRPDAAAVGVLFDPANHRLDFAANGNPCTGSAGSVTGYLLALERLQVPYDVLAASHLADLSRYRVILAPWTMIMRPGVATALVDWVRAGGTLFVESELDAYDELGFYRYPADRPFATALGVAGLGRRPIPDDVVIESAFGQLHAATWLEPLVADDSAEVLASTEFGPLLLRRPLADGAVIAAGTHLGLAYRTERNAGLESLLSRVIADAAAGPLIRCSVDDGQVLQWRTGLSGSDRLIFIANHGPRVQVRFSGPAGYFDAAHDAIDLLSGTAAEVSATEAGSGLSIWLDEGASAVVNVRG